MKTHETKKTHILMHKNIPVLECGIHPETGKIEKIFSCENPAHVPVGVRVRNEKPERDSLNEWWRDRAIPQTRMKYGPAMEALQVSSPLLLLKKSRALCLSDQNKT